MRIDGLTQTFLLALIANGLACQCGDPATKTGGLSPHQEGPVSQNGERSAYWNPDALELLLAGLPESKVENPLDAIPRDLPWRITSEDPSAWLRFAQSRESFQSLMKTPLAQELRTQGPWRFVESLRKQITDLSSFVGRSEANEGVLQGQLALGARSIDEDRPAFVAIKRVVPEIQVVARFVAAFADLRQESFVPENPADAIVDPAKRTLRTEKVGSVELHTLYRPGTDLHFSLFRNLLIFGSDLELVRDATRIAAGTTPPQPDAHASVWPPQEEPGVHIAWQPPSDGPLALLAIDALGLSLRLDARTPFALRLHGGQKAHPNASILLRYAPGTTFGAWMDGRKPPADLLQQVRRRVVETTANHPWDTSKIEEVEHQIGAHLEGGIAMWLSNDPSDAQNPSPRGVVAFRHANKTALEPALRTFLSELTAQQVKRVVLETVGNSFLLTTGEEGPAAALSDDALLVALSPAPLRDALHAGHGKSRSILDAAGKTPNVAASHALYLDLQQGAAFLRNFYRAAFAGQASPSWEEVAPILEPTFSGLATGGVLVGELTATGEHGFAGGIDALP